MLKFFDRWIVLSNQTKRVIVSQKSAEVSWTCVRLYPVQLSWLDTGEFHLLTFDRSAVNLSNLKIILNYLV